MAERPGRHECELFSGRVPEAEESEYNWRTCQKNPKHVEFIPAPDFVSNYLPRIQGEKEREGLKSVLDLTVRLRIRYTSQGRPDGSDFSELRGTYGLRLGTGFVNYVCGPEDEPCTCHGKEQWGFFVETALHVVFDDQEAVETVVDVFYDDSESQKDGRMKSVMAVKAVELDPDRDYCTMRCVTCDEDLIERIASALKGLCIRGVEPTRKILEDLGLQQSCSNDYNPVLIVSHPHGQPKQVTVGELRYEADGFDRLRQYTTPTCSGSSGAPVFLFDSEDSLHFLTLSFHSGGYDETCPERYDKLSLPNSEFNEQRGHEQPVKQLNYGYLNYSLKNWT